MVPREEECRAVVGKPGKGNVDVAPPSDVGGGGPKDGEVLFWPSCLQIPAAATGHLVLSSSSLIFQPPKITTFDTRPLKALAGVMFPNS